MDKQKILELAAANPGNALVNFDPQLVAKAPAEAKALVIDDNILVAGQVCAAGSRMLYNFRPPFSATAVLRAEGAGYAVVGRGNIDEFAMAGSGESSWFGPTLNPLDPAHVAGGSAAAVAQGIAEAALIVDGGGVGLRLAAFAGQVGFRPTYGAISRFGLVANISSCEQVAGVAPSVDQAAALVQAAAGHDPQDATSLPEPPPMTAGEGVAGKRVALITTRLSDKLTPAVEQRLAAAEGLLTAAGAKVEQVDLPELNWARPALLVIAAAEGANNISRFDGVKYGFRATEYRNIEELYCRSRSQGMGAAAKLQAILGAYVLSKGRYEQYFAKALQGRRRIKDRFNLLFQDYDAAVLPLADGPAYPLGAAAGQGLAEADLAWGAGPALANLPAVGLPLAGGGALPLSLQVIADCGRDSQALAVAAILEGGLD